MRSHGTAVVTTDSNGYTGRIAHRLGVVPAGVQVGVLYPVVNQAAGGAITAMVDDHVAGPTATDFRLRLHRGTTSGAPTVLASTTGIRVFWEAIGPLADDVPVVGSGVGTLTRRYGVVTNNVATGATNSDTQLALSTALAAKVHRARCEWSVVQPTSATGWTWTDVDATVNNATARGLTTILALGSGWPAWANGTSGSPDTKVVPAYPGTGGTFNTFRDYFATFCAEVVARYKGRPVVYEIGYRPNDAAFYYDATSLAPSAAGFAVLFNTARTAMRATDPAVRVGLGGLTGITTTPTGTNVEGITYLNSVLGAVTLGAGDAVGVDVTPAQAQAPDATVANKTDFLDFWKVRERLDAVGAGQVPIWIDAWGWQVTGGVTAAVQATYVANSLRLLQQNVKNITGGRVYAAAATDPRVEYANYFLDQDVTGLTGWGLYDTTSTARASAGEFKAFARTFNPAT